MSNHMNSASDGVRKSICSKSICVLSVDQITKLDDDYVNILEDIPIVSYFIKTYKHAVSISDKLFLRTTLRYLFELKDIPIEDRIKFIGDIAARGDDEAGFLILSMLNKIDNINKAVILANLTKAKINNEITVSDFFRLSVLLERIPYIDIMELLRYKNPFYQEGITELLFTTGAIQLVVINGGNAQGEGDSLYALTTIGVQFVRFGLREDVEDIKYRDVYIPSMHFIDGGGS